MKHAMYIVRYGNMQQTLCMYQHDICMYSNYSWSSVGWGALFFWKVDGCTVLGTS